MSDSLEWHDGDPPDNTPNYAAAVGVPLAVYIGRVPNPHILYGQEDVETGPVTFNRIGTRWGDLQLSNGWQRTNYGKRLTYQGAEYLAAIAPSIPGQTRLMGRTSGDFPARGMAPSQWAFHVASGPGLQPDSPGGPGMTMGNTVINNHMGGGA